MCIWQFPSKQSLIKKLAYNRSMNLSQTVRLLGNILGQVLVEQESKEIFEIEEQIRKLSKNRRREIREQRSSFQSKLKL